MPETTDRTVVPVSIEQAARCLAVAFAANVPIALWGAVGTGKSSIVKQVSQRLGYQMFDVRLSDKEPADIGGIPTPNGDRVKWLLPETIPFECIYQALKCVLFLDEFDRADIAVQNAALQLLLDRMVNGQRLSPNCLIVVAGNSTTDIGTNPLTDAAANRMCHLYIQPDETDVRSYEKWGLANGVSKQMISFSKFRTATWDGVKVPPPTQMAIPTRRSFDYADRLYQTMQGVNFPTTDLRMALVSGCVGRPAAVEFLSFMDLQDKAPTIADIILCPDEVLVPEDLSVLYALSLQFAPHIKAFEGHIKSRIETACRFATYVKRWPEEMGAYAMNLIVEACPEVLTRGEL